MQTNIFDRLSFVALFLVVVLLPIFFLPGTLIPVEVSKSLLLVLGLAFCIIFWAIARFYDGKIILPKSPILVGGVGVLLVFFLSALFGGVFETSFFGTMMDVGTFSFIFASFLLMLFSAIIFRNPQNARMVLFGLTLSFSVVLIFQSLRFFMPDFLSLGVFVGKTGNLLGSWNTFGLFAGFSALMSLLIIEFFSVKKWVKWLLQSLIVLSMLLVAAVNFPFIWELLGIFSLIVFVYKVSVISNGKKDEGTKTHFPILCFTVVIISLLFFMSGAFVGEVLPNRLGLSTSEVSPSFFATVSVTKSALRNNPILGIGPNRFEEIWAKYKPRVINATQFWDVSFNSGSGLLPTIVSTTGILGIFAWLAFFILFIWAGAKSLFSGIKKGLGSEAMTFFVLSFYLFIASFFFPTGGVVLLSAFALGGVFIGLSLSDNPSNEIFISFLDDHRKSFFSFLLLMFVMIISVALSFKYIERLTAFSYFQKALSVSKENAEVAIDKAVILYPNDLYLRTYMQIYLNKLNSIATKGILLSDADKAEMQAILDKALNAALRATTYNPKNYLNFQSLGSFYQNLVSLGVKDAPQKASEVYKVASNLNPVNPRLKLLIANALLNEGKLKEAKEYANIALSLKADYTDASDFLKYVKSSENIIE